MEGMDTGLDYSMDHMGSEIQRMDLVTNHMVCGVELMGHPLTLWATQTMSTWA